MRKSEWRCRGWRWRRGRRWRESFPSRYRSFFKYCVLRQNLLEFNLAYVSVRSSFLKLDRGAGPLMTRESSRKRPWKASSLSLSFPFSPSSSRTISTAKKLDCLHDNHKPQTLTEEFIKYGPLSKSTPKADATAVLLELGTSPPEITSRSRKSSISRS